MSSFYCLCLRIKHKKITTEVYFSTAFCVLSFHKIFKDHAIDGETLPLLTEEHLLDTMGLKLGPALKIRSQVWSLNVCPNGKSQRCESEANRMKFFQTKLYFFLTDKVTIIILGKKKNYSSIVCFCFSACYNSTQGDTRKSLGLVVWETL